MLRTPKFTLSGNFVLIPAALNKPALLQGGPRRSVLTAIQFTINRCYCSWRRVDQSCRRISQSSSGRRVPVDLFPRKLTDWMLPTWTIDLTRQLKCGNMVGEMFAEVSIVFLMFAKLWEMRYFEYFGPSKYRIEVDKNEEGT